MNKIYNIIPIVLLILGSDQTEAKRMIIQWHSFDCTPNKEFVNYHRCFFVDSSKTLISGEVDYNRGFESFFVYLALHLPRPPFQEYYKLADFTMDACQFFKGSISNKLIKTAYKSMLVNSNMPRKCPQRKGFYYYYNMSVGDNVQPFLPKYDFRVQLDFFLPNAPMFNISLKGRLTTVAAHKAKKP